MTSDQVKVYLNVFSVPEIVVPKVKLSEILDLLRNRTNQGYMPKSHGKVKFNSKPEYTRRADEQFPGFPSRDVMLNYGSGYYCLQDRTGYQGQEPIFFYMEVGHFQVVINLTTEKALVRFSNPDRLQDKGFVEWNPEDPLHALPIMRDELKEVIDIYG